MNNNKSKFNVSRSTKQLQSTGKMGEAKFNVEQAAEAIRPPMSKSLGSFACHIYVNDVTREIIFQNQVQLRLDGSGEEVTEFIASKALDELRLKLMDTFGRNENGRKV